MDSNPHFLSRIIFASGNRNSLFSRLEWMSQNVLWVSLKAMLWASVSTLMRLKWCVQGKNGDQLSMLRTPSLPHSFEGHWFGWYHCQDWWLLPLCWWHKIVLLCCVMVLWRSLFTMSCLNKGKGSFRHSLFFLPLLHMCKWFTCMLTVTFPLSSSSATSWIIFSAAILLTILLPHVRCWNLRVCVYPFVCRWGG